MKLILLSVTCFVSFMVLCQCKSETRDAEPSDPELALCMMILKIVDQETGEAVSEFSGVNFQESGIETFSSPNPISRTLSMRIAKDEGLIFASWVAPIRGIGGLKIEVDGFDPLTVDPLAEEIHKGYSYNFSQQPTLDQIQRTVTMRRSEQVGTGQPATRPQSKSEASQKPQPESEGRSR